MVVPMELSLAGLRLRNSLVDVPVPDKSLKECHPVCQNILCVE